MEVETIAQNKLAIQLERCGIPPASVASLIGRHTLVSYPKGGLLFLQGSPADVVFAIFSGMVKIYCPCADGSRILVEVAGPGDLVGYADFLDPQSERAQIFEAQALTSCRVALLTRNHLTKILKQLEPDVLLRVFELMNSYWSTVSHRYAVFLSMSLRERLQIVLNELGARFGVKEARGLLLTSELNQQEISEMIGGSRPMVSKLLSEMIERGTLAQEGRRYVLLAKTGAKVTSQSLQPAAY
jgi:CRP/FNR family transcriptional regulator